MTKELEFKNAFFATLQDVQQDGSKDPEAMWLLGSLASDLADDYGQPSWSAAKASMTAEQYDGLLASFRTEGNAHHKEGRTKHAYAIQALVFSLIARTQPADEQLDAASTLLDQLIDRAATLYRQQKQTAQ